MEGHGHVGGHDRRADPTLARPQRKSATVCFRARGARPGVLAGSGLAFRATRSFLFEGMGRLYSPTLKDFINMVPEQLAPPVI